MYTYYFEVVSICHRKKVSSLDESDDYRPGLFVESDLESDTESESQSPEHQTFPIDTNYAKDHIFTSQDYGTIRVSIYTNTAGIKHLITIGIKYKLFYRKYTINRISFHFW